MDKETDARFKEAVERKNEQAQQAADQNPDAPPSSDQNPSQDVNDPRAKNSRHGQVTADKWNQ
ncbi:hypothetical protein DVA67_026625 [Solirubrobacter sp. CPCC 204708]|uniref:Uncharacterized protein n=1 Tax=Solirubrobacter deserti TaxID=2282478 RepID=A0ABT4RF29_9ACTN|nr:hypothetical protein [Solirubrobacter deserti]MBE2319571.1 hypothetical protein [Solirubrobacter deserti]MDA0137142.1 hypothetical protein [Solirubrobacter deserti]